jgi:hypothetical protein
VITHEWFTPKLAFTTILRDNTFWGVTINSDDYIMHLLSTLHPNVKKSNLESINAECECPANILLIYLKYLILVGF